MISSSQNLEVFAMMGMAVIGLAGIVLIIFIYTEAAKPPNKFKLIIPPHNIEEEKNETNERTCHVQTGQPLPMTTAKLETEKGNAEIRVKHQETELKECRKEKEDLLRRLQCKDNELQMNIKENGELRRSLSEQKSQEERMQKELNQEREEKDQALKRLSAIMSSRLKDGNPNVVDLNDQNRPTKIGEKYSELYDNQWTDAYGALESNFGDNEQQIIEILRFMIEQSFSKCKDDATAQLDNFRKGIETLAGSIATKSKTLTNDMMQRLKEERKAFAIDCQPSVESVGQAIAQSLTDHFDSLDFLKHPTLQAYLEECVRLCWFMVIQDPPMVLISNPGQNQSHLFRSYLHNGPHMKFVVWPALLLSDQGSLVMKGTAEFTGQPQ